MPAHVTISGISTITKRLFLPLAAAAAGIRAEREATAKAEAAVGQQAAETLAATDEILSEPTVQEQSGGLHAGRQPPASG